KLVEKMIFVPSGLHDGPKFAPRSGHFDLYMVSASESMAGADKLERITFDGTFDGFPMFSPDGKRLLWASNRYAKTTGETNLFVADFRWE
ncbi:MAG: TolB family protein, partial [Gemmatimonadota bacterium]